MIKLIRNVFWHKFLLYNLVKSEIKSRYKQAFLGLAWVIFQPLALMFIFTIVFSRIVKVPSDGAPYPIFAFSALLPWTLFTNSLSRGINSIVASSALIKKIYFPREIIVFSYVLAPILDFIVSLGVLSLLMTYYKVAISLSILWVLPIIIIEIIFVSGVALLLASLNVFARDITHALPLLVQLWMYLTPVVYPLKMVPARFKSLYMVNPMVAIINSFREAVLKGGISDWGGLGAAAGVSFLIFIAGYAVFKKLEMKFVDVI